MGGPGSGGYKSAPGDTETHSAWTIIAQDPESGQKLAQVRCKYCAREMAQHTSRQRAHLLGCQAYLDAMKETGVENSITRQAADPASFFKSSKNSAGMKEPKPPKTLNLQEHSIAVRIQALALAEASISSERIHEITGIDPRVLAGIRALARERGYNPSVSMQMKEEYVEDPPDSNRGRGRPKKRKPEDELDPSLTSIHQARAPPGYVQASSLPPGDWNFHMAAPVSHGYPTIT